MRLRFGCWLYGLACGLLPLSVYAAQETVNGSDFALSSSGDYLSYLTNNTVSVADGQNLGTDGGIPALSAITNAASRGAIQFFGTHTVSGGIGTNLTNNYLDSLLAWGNAGKTLTFNGDVYADRLHLIGSGVVNVNANLNLNDLYFQNATATLNVASGYNVSLTSGIAQFMGSPGGVLNFVDGAGSTSQFTGNLLAGNDPLANIVVNVSSGRTVELHSNVDVINTTISNGGTLKLFGWVSGSSINVTNGVLDGTNGIVNADVNIDTTSGGRIAALNLSSSGHTVAFTGDGVVTTPFGTINGGTGDDTIDISLNAPAFSVETNGDINLGGGTDTIALKEGTLIVNNNVTATSTVMSAVGGSSLTLVSGTYNAGNIISAGSGNKNININGGTLANNINFSAAGGTNRIDWGNGQFNGSIIGGTAGTDTLTVTAGNHTAQAAVSGVENIAVSGGNLTISNATVTGVNGALNIASGRTLTANNTLSGSGALTFNGILNIGAGQTVTMGTLAAAGASSELDVNLTKTAASKLVLTGSGANLTTTVFAVRMDPSSGYVASGTSYTIVSTSAASTAGTVSETSFIYDYLLSTSTNGKDLILTVNRANSFDAVAVNTQNKSVGQVLESAAPAAAGELLNVVNQLEGMSNGAFMNSAITTLNPAVNGVDTTSMDMQTSSMNLAQTRLAEVRSRGTGIATGDAAANGAVWMRGFGSHQNQGNRNGAAGFSSTSRGMSLGADTDQLLEGDTMGVAASYVTADVNDKSDTHANTRIESHALTLYGSHPFGGGFFTDGMLSTGINEYNGTKVVSVGGFQRQVTSDYEGWQGSARFSVGKAYENAGYRFTPYTSLQYDYLDVDDYTESGAGNVSLRVSPKSTTALVSQLGGKLACDFNVGSGLILRPEARLAQTYNWRENNFTTTSAFTGGGAAFRTESARISRFSTQMGLGLTLGRNGSLEASAQYDAEVRSNAVSHNGQLNLKLYF